MHTSVVLVTWVFFKVLVVVTVLEFFSFNFSYLIYHFSSRCSFQILYFVI